MSLGISYQISAVDKISRVADKISSKVDKMDNKIEKVGRTSEKVNRKMKRSFKGMGRSASRLGGKLKALAGLAVGAFALKNVFSRGMDFEDSIASISAITGATGKNLQFYSDQAIKLSEKYGVAASEIATGIKDIGSAKSDLLGTPAALIEITDKSLELAKAAGISVPEAVRAAVGSLNQYGKSAEFAGKFTNILAAGATVGASEIPDMIEALKNSGAIAKASGVDFLTTNAALQAMSKNSIKGAEAGTGLAGVLRFIKKQANGLKGLNVEKMGLIPVLEMIDKARKNKSLDLTLAFGEHEKSMLALVDNLKHLKTFRKQITEDKTAVSRQAKVRMDTTREKLARARSRMDKATLGLFAKLEPLVSSMVDKFIKWVDSLTSDDIEKFGRTIDSIVAGALMIAKTLGNTVNATKTVGSLVGEGTAAVASGDFSNFSDTSKAGAMGVVSNMGMSPLFGFLSAMTRDDSKTKLEITMKGNTENIASVKQTTEKLNSGNSKRKSRVKSNMGQ